MPDLDLIVASGGPGTQTGEAAWSGILLRSYFDGHDVDEWNGTNGVAIASGAGANVTVFGASSGIDVGVGVLAGLDLVGACVAVTAVTTTSNEGYYEITAHDDDTLTVDTLSVDGVLTLVDADSVSWQIGGAGSSGVDQIDTIIGTYLNDNAVEVLTNLDETPGVDINLGSAGTVLYPIIYTGTIYDNSVVNNNFVRATDVADMPVIDMGTDNTFTASGEYLRVRNISVTGEHTSSHVVIFDSIKGILEQCVIEQTSTNSNALAALHTTGSGDGAVFRNNHIKTVSPRTAADGAAIYSTGERTQFIMNFVESTTHGIYADSSSAACLVNGNIVVGNGGGIGIQVNNSDGTRLLGIHNNSVYNFTTGILADVGGGALAQTTILNNVIWGGSIGTVIGIENTAEATAINCLIDGNAIGNVDTAYEFGDLIIENKIDLGANNPFDNPGGTNAVDYILNTGTGGNLCRSTAKPNDYDSDGTQDSWGDVGALQAEPTGGAGGGVMPLTGLLS